MDQLTATKVRSLSQSDLGLPASVPSDALIEQLGLNDSEILELLKDEHPTMRAVRDAFDLGFAGVILVGPPGTGKSWLAKRIASSLSNNTPDTTRFVQFHSSYQYEDFMEGYAPSADGVIKPTKKIFPLLCEAAQDNPGVTYVLVIDEISRCDAARVFGEALTYIEVDKRNLKFTLASGREMSVPSNLAIIATMNPWDKGVDEVDVALERRFAQIDVLPNADDLRSILERRGADGDVTTRVITFFQKIQALDEERCHLGHAYFLDCLDNDAAELIWKFRLSPFFRRACRLDPMLYNSIAKLWQVGMTPAPATSPQMEPAGEITPEPGAS